MITAKGQVTISKAIPKAMPKAVPKGIREALKLRQADQLRWDLDEGGRQVRLVSPEDEQVFADL